MSVRFRKKIQELLWKKVKGVGTKNEIVYDLRHFERDFNGTEQVNGLELALAEPKKDIRIKMLANEQREAGIPYVSGDKIFSLRAVWKNDSNTQSALCNVYVDETHGEWISANCSCSEFNRNRYCCCHVTALLSQYLMDHWGAEIFRGTKIEKKLAEQAGVPDPFVPGVLRKTDQDLLEMLNMPQVGNMDPLAEFATNTELHMECHLAKEKGGVSLELKIGSKRRYVIKSMLELFRFCDEGRVYQIGKTDCLSSLDQFDVDGRRAMELLLGQYRHKKSTPYFSTMFLRTNGSYNERYVYLEGRDLDAWMENVGEIPCYVGDDQVRIRLDGAGPEISMERQPYGMLLKTENFFILAKTEDWIYFQTGDRVSRTRNQQGGRLGEILELLSGKSEFYIRNKELPLFFGQMLPAIEDQTEIQTTGFALDEYRPEIPKVSIYLDISQDEIISCQVKCRYDRSGKEYLLYDEADRSVRNNGFEEELRRVTGKYFNAYDETNKSMCLSGGPEELYHFLTESVTELGKSGEVFISDALQKLKVRKLPSVDIGIRMDTGLLYMSIQAPDMTKDELAEILSLYSNKKKFFRLKNGSFMTTDPEKQKEWAVLAETFLQYGKKDPASMEIPAFRALYLDEMLKNRDGISLEENRKYKELLFNMDTAKEANDEVPESLRGILRPYQADGFRWMKTLKRCGFCGILADDMGLGKTLQMLTFLLSEKEEGKTGDELRTLIVTPASLVYNWKKEIGQFVPELSCKVITGNAAERQEMIQNEEDRDIWITSYDLLKRDIACYENIRFANQVIDEAQYIKNHGTQAAKSVRLIQSGFRMALTGTPMENRLSELWSIFDFLMPGFLYGYQGFREKFEEAIMNDRDEEVSARLRSMVHPFILRRLKKDVLTELPDKIEKTVTIELEGEQRKLYDAYAKRLKLYLEKQSKEEFKQSKLEVLKELTRLRQLCCGPELFLENYHGENAKMDACVELVRQAVDGGHKVLLFSQFTSVLDEIEKALAKEKIEDHRIDGSVSKEQRIRLVDSFETDDVPVFCISLKAGGTGLNLTAADIVIHYDPWWNVAAQNQATDRAHRIGQRNTVTVYDLIAENTIEEQIKKLQESKSALAEEILSGEGIQSIVLDRDEILKML